MGRALSEEEEARGCRVAILIGDTARRCSLLEGGGAHLNGSSSCLHRGVARSCACACSCVSGLGAHQCDGTGSQLMWYVVVVVVAVVAVVVVVVVGVVVAVV